MVGRIFGKHLPSFEVIILADSLNLVNGKPLENGNPLGVSDFSEARLKPLQDLLKMRCFSEKSQLDDFWPEDVLSLQPRCFSKGPKLGSPKSTPADIC